jgi:hypothetical protein
MGRDRRETSVTPAEPDGQTGAVAGRQIQRLVSGLVPRTCGASMEAESHTWLVRCLSCGFERSIWELGGVPWKASGTSWTWSRRPNCTKRR